MPDLTKTLMKGAITGIFAAIVFVGWNMFAATAGLLPDYGEVIVSTAVGSVIQSYVLK